MRKVGMGLMLSLLASLLLILLSAGVVSAQDTDWTKARAEASAGRVRVGEWVRFDARGSSPGQDAQMRAWYWDFDDLDRVTVEAMGDTASHVFNHAGAYNVRLVVENDRGERDETTLSVEVLPDTDQGPLLTDRFEGGKSGQVLQGQEDFVLRLEWGPQFYFRIDNARGKPVSLRIIGYGPNRGLPPSVTPYADDTAFDDEFVLMSHTDYHAPDWQPLTAAKYRYDSATEALVVEFTPQAEAVYLAWAPAWTMRDQLRLLDRWEDRPEFEWQTIGLSVEGRPLYQLTVTDPQAPDEGKKVVWITGTQHGYEMAAGPVIEGIIATLFEDSDSARAALREHIYHFVPLMNPDAVFQGGYRYNLHQVDLNRNWDDRQQDPWDRPGPEPEVMAAQRAIEDWVYDRGRLDIFMDFHCLTRLAGGLLMIKAVPDSVPPAVAARQDRLVEHFQRRYDWRVSEERSSAPANGQIAARYVRETGVLSYTPEHSLGWITPVGEQRRRTTPSLLRQLGRDYVWTIREFFRSEEGRGGN